MGICLVIGSWSIEADSTLTHHLKVAMALMDIDDLDSVHSLCFAYMIGSYWTVIYYVDDSVWIVINDVDGFDWIGIDDVVDDVAKVSS